MFHKKKHLTKFYRKDILNNVSQFDEFFALITQLSLLFDLIVHFIFVCLLQIQNKIQMNSDKLAPCWSFRTKTFGH